MKIIVNALYFFILFSSNIEMIENFFFFSIKSYLKFNHNLLTKTLINIHYIFLLLSIQILSFFIFNYVNNNKIKFIPLYYLLL